MLGSPTKRSPALVMVITLAAVGFVLWGASYLGTEVGRGNESGIREIVVAVFGAVGVIMILRQPVLGLSMVVGSLLIQNELQEVRFITSMFTLLGVITAFAYILTRQDRRFFTRFNNPPLMLMSAYIMWTVISNPSAAIDGTRNWLWTYIQLLMLAALAAELFNEKKLNVLLWTFMLACIPSALQSFMSAQITTDFSEDLVRGSGFQGNQNTLAFYLIIATVMTLTLHFQTKDRRMHVVFFVLYAIYALGVVGTVSRAGFLLLIVAWVLTPVIRRLVTPPPANLDEQKRRRRQRSSMILLGIVLVGGLTTFVIPDEYWGYLNNTLFRSNERDTGTQRRLELAELAFNTWTNYPITGAGVGMFTEVSGEELGKEQSSHNMYLSVLAETGIVGFALFIGWMLAALRELYLMARKRDGERSYMAALWLTILLLIFMRGPTASTLHYDKLVWMISGVAVALSVRYAPKQVDAGANLPTNPLVRRASRVTPGAQIIEAQE